MVATTEYFTNGSTILAEKTGNNILWYIYDSDGDLLGFTYNGTPYYYVKNAQNDVYLILDENGYAQVRLPSGEVRMIRLNCKATIGVIGNEQHENISIGKAGRKRHMGWRPTVRGVVMNPNDHPHGGGEGKSPIGRPAPVTPWGKPALGLKTRKKKNKTNKFIVKRRNDK